MPDLDYSTTYLPVTLSNTDGKSQVMKTGTLVTTAVTADQVVLTYTVTAGKTLYLQYASVSSTSTAFANNVVLGTISIESPAGTKLVTNRFTAISSDPFVQEFPEPLFFTSGTVLRFVCTPASTTSMTWIGNLGGYER